jgi:carboxypeptidase Taq
MMPPNASDSRAKQMSVVAGVLHDKNTNPEIGASLDILEKSDLSSLNEWEKAVIRDARRNYNKTTKIPKKLAQREAELASIGQDTWVVARKENDFPKFAPILKDWVALRKEIAQCVDPSKSAYDVLLDDYERGLSSARLNDIFTQGNWKSIIANLQ